MKTLLHTTLKCSAAALALLALPSAAMAADDGTPGQTSTGTLTVSLVVDAPPIPQLQVVGLQDMDAGRVLVTDATGLPTQMSAQIFTPNSLACFNGPTNTPILITANQLNAVGGRSDFHFVGTIDSDSNGTVDLFPAILSIEKEVLFTIGNGMTPNVSKNGIASDNSCNQANKSSSNGAFRITFYPDANFLNNPTYRLSNSDFSELSALIQITIASQ